MRKIIQIATMPETSDDSSATLALCDDGSLWAYQHGEWKICKSVPQHEINHEPNP